MGKRTECPLGPRTRGREGGSGSPRVLVPQPQAPQAILARPSWLAASRLGCRPTLPGGVENAAWARPRALEVGQMLLCSRSWGPCHGPGRSMGYSSPTTAHVCGQSCKLMTIMLSTHEHRPLLGSLGPASVSQIEDLWPHRLSSNGQGVSSKA